MAEEYEQRQFWETDKPKKIIGFCIIKDRNDEYWTFTKETGFVKVEKDREI